MGKMAEWLWRVTQAISLLDTVESILVDFIRGGSNPPLVNSSFHVFLILV